MSQQLLDQALDSFAQFWTYYFPEMETLPREVALEQINDAVDGAVSKKPDDLMAQYQDRVAKVYGAYETAQFQMVTLWQIMTHIKGFFPGMELVSLGAGPGSYELWLLTVSQLAKVTLVDHSGEMLSRANEIAESLQEQARMKNIVTDATQSNLLDASADIVFSINALHWSKNWKRWISEAARIAKSGAEVFISCSLGHPRSGIQPDQFVAEAAKYFDLADANFIMPPQPMPNGQLAQSSRFFIYGRKR